ncbi:hypothetical protein GFC01_04450 [Desulfofundulus thermobenzoicus]|uniref:SLH domain-containing protein n=1 Tax=Desulfofundulus thermobenzoicus TaxID=29376 RepID=A0A6N7INF8_9FIRM|nr:S-layer homology domain-containing protein [Desulfofundulus thermobenzoicus]MQL51526.1 hypothetical protein [Desulfofundulus thermobenzoicus]
MFKRKCLVYVLLALFLLALPAAAGAAGDDPVVRSRSTEIIGEGAALTTYILHNRDGQIKAYVLKLDLTNPYLELKTLVGAAGTLENRAPLTRMVEGQKNAVAAVNAGFFVMANGKPVGTIIRDGELVSSPNMRGDMPVFALDENRRPLLDFFQFSGEVKTAGGKSYPLFGVNKPAYNLTDGSLSDSDHLTLYNRLWGTKTRGGDPDHPEAMVARVENGIVREVLPAKDAAFDIPANGYVLWGAGAAAAFIRDNLTPGTPVTVSYKTTPDYQKIKVAAGSNSFLVQRGQVAPFQEELRGKTARTAVGYADGGKTLYFVVVEKSPESAGMEQRDLARFLVTLGLTEALNLDGGGSTTLVARHLGDGSPTLINRPKEGQERLIPDAIGIYNNAPPGAPAGLIISGPDTVVAGTYAEYSVQGYDSHYHPWQPENIQWDLPAGTKLIEENIYNGVYRGTFSFTGAAPAAATLTAQAGGVRGAKNLRVIRAGDLRALQVTPARISARRGESIPLTFQVITAEGQVIPIPAQFVSCQTTTGTVKEGTFLAGQERGRGIITAAFDGLTAEVPVQVECLFTDSSGSWAFEQIEDLGARGILKGFADGTFRPNQPVTRAEMTALLARVLNWPPATGEVRFKDTLPAWAKGVIAAGVAQNMVKGYPDGTFRADNRITRAELCALLDRALKPAPAAQQLPFRDASAIPSWARDSVARVVAGGLMGGYEDNTLRPGWPVTRAEMAAIIWRHLKGKAE